MTAVLMCVVLLILLGVVIYAAMFTWSRQRP